MVQLRLSSRAFRNASSQLEMTEVCFGKTDLAQNHTQTRHRGRPKALSERGGSLLRFNCAASSARTDTRQCIFGLELNRARRSALLYKRSWRLPLSGYDDRPTAIISFASEIALDLLDALESAQSSCSGNAKRTGSPTVFRFG